MLRFTGQYIFFIDLLLSLIEVNVFFLMLIQVNYIFSNTNTGKCIFFVDLFLSLIEVNVYFF